MVLQERRLGRVYSELLHIFDVYSEVKSMPAHEWGMIPTTGVREALRASENSGVGCRGRNRPSRGVLLDAIMIGQIEKLSRSQERERVLTTTTISL